MTVESPDWKRETAKWRVTLDWHEMNTLQELQRWYLSRCNGDWERGYGVEIGTLDNPGWRVVVNLTDTPLADKPFTDVKKLEHETDWIHCRVQSGKFEGHGGPLMLEEILQVFFVQGSVLEL